MNKGLNHSGTPWRHRKRRHGRTKLKGWKGQCDGVRGWTEAAVTLGVSIKIRWAARVRSSASPMELSKDLMGSFIHSSLEDFRHSCV